MGEILDLRRVYHRSLCRCLLGYRPGTQIPNIADKSSSGSVEVSQCLVKKLRLTLHETDVTGQKCGQEFASITADFIRETFSKLEHLRPGTWRVSTSQAERGIAAFDQYEHLGHLQDILNKYPELKTTLGGDYLITPDIIVSRQAEPDEVINDNRTLLLAGENVVSYSPLRRMNVPNCPSILHASISCKWTIRSDRAQNTRTEALNLIRNRKGHTPHIVAVTFEPLPTRLASIALGTGDLDCMYHVALGELLEAIDELGDSDHKEVVQGLVQGRRLRDISDLPVDLAT
jgi:hypothetical protein